MRRTNGFEEGVRRVMVWLISPRMRRTSWLEEEARRVRVWGLGVRAFTNTNRL
jgi:hypothetical protein